MGMLQCFPMHWKALQHSQGTEKCREAAVGDFL